MRRVFSELVVCAVLVGCVRPGVVTCEDGTSVCPQGKVCAPLLGGEGFACVGETSACGNGVIESFVLVDAGFAVVGETCDDGNQRPHDGCSSACTLEQPRWRPRVLGHPTHRRDASIAYDPQHDQFVLFGGLGSSGGLADTWIGTYVACATAGWCLGWERVSPPNAPSARLGAAMAYDRARGRVVLFGGGSTTPGAGLFDDLWEWDGKTWTEVPVAQRPPGRSHAAVAYDHGRRRLVVHGGRRRDARGQLVHDDETWEWDGEDKRWTQITPSPPADAGHVMAYDPVRGTIVMFTKTEATAQTYEYDGTWSAKQPATSPPPREDAALVFDPVTGGVLLFGGRRAPAMNLDLHLDAWRWDGTTWTEEAAPIRESWTAVAAADPIRRRVISVTGATGPGGDELAGDSLEWVGGWRLSTVVRPSEEDHAAIYDPVRDRVVLLGTKPLEGVWELQRSTWSQTPGPGFAGASLAYAARHRRTFSFGGIDMTGGALANTLAAWDGTTWMPRVPLGEAPSPRRDGAIAYDDHRDRVVLFGGLSAEPLDDMWEWDDTTSSWTRVEVVTPNPARSCHVLGYDPIRGYLVLFGGNDGSKDLGDTWLYHPETGWEQYLGQPPPARCDAAMTWSSARRRLVMFGGRNAGALQHDTWEWTGFAWEQVPADGPLGRSAHTLAATASGVIMIGGRGVGEEVWELTWDSSVAEDRCRDRSDSDGDGLAGCDDPDCAAICTPSCMPVAGELVCPAGAPRCGDGVADPLETCRLCPEDVACSPPLCGDVICDPGETVATCPGDCSP